MNRTSGSKNAVRSLLSTGELLLLALGAWATACGGQSESTPPNGSDSSQTATGQAGSSSEGAPKSPEGGGGADSTKDVAGPTIAEAGSTGTVVDSAGSGGDTGGAAGSPATGQGGGNDEGATDGDGEAGKAGADADMGEAEADADMGEAEADADASGTLSFAEPMFYPGGSWAMDIGVADLNGDGALDVASADFSNVTGGVFVWLNQGDGSFAAASPYLLGEHGVSIEVADINGDKKPDLITATEDSLSALLNNGDGTFPLPSRLAGTGYGVRALDANADGQLDFLAGTTLYLNQGGAQFDLSAKKTAGRPWVATDLNGDGMTDVVGAGVGVFVSLGLGAGDFAPSVLYDVGVVGKGTTTRGTAVGDINHDGWPDIATVNDSDASAAVLFNQGDGTFSKPDLYATGSWPTSVALGDLDADGWPELVVANSGAATLHTSRPYLAVYRNLGDGTFAPPEEFLEVGYPYAVMLADLNGDGKLDITVGDGGGRLAVVLNTTR